MLRGHADASDVAQGAACAKTTRAASADVAKQYPLVFCTTTGFGHADQASVIPAFTRFFELMDPAP